MKTGILLSVREKATRLPGKVLKPLGDRTVTAFLLERLKTSRQADRIIVATSDDPRDRVLIEIAAECGVTAFAGHPEDKLVRYRDAAHAYDMDFVVVVDGDDPFCSVEHIDRIIESAGASGGDYIVFEGLPLGATGFGVAVSALDAICQSKSQANTEIWGHLFTENPAFRSVRLKEDDPLFNRTDIRLTLDYPQDYEMMTAVVRGIGRRERPLSLRDVLSYLEKHPDVCQINRNVQEHYEQHLMHSKETIS